MKKRRVLLRHVRQLMMMTVCVNVRMNDGGGGCDGARAAGRVSRQRRLRLRRVKRVAVACDQARVAGTSGPSPGRSPSPSPYTAVRGAVAVRMMAEDDPREGHGSLMMLRGTVRVVRLRDHVVARGWRVTGVRMMMTAGRRVVIRVVGAAVVVVVLLLRLPLAVLLVLHPPVLEPDLHLPLGQVQVPRQLPPLLLRNVRVEQELLLQLQRLELGVGLAFLPHRHLAGPLQGVRATATDPHPGHADAHADPRQGTCGKQRRWGGTPHHLTQLVCR